MTIRLVTMAAAAATVLLGAGLAQAGTFTCRIASDGKAVDALIVNPFKQTTSCQVNCQVATERAGTTFQTSCTKEIAPGEDAVLLCSKTYDKGRLVKVVGGSGNCINPVPAEEKADKDDDVDVQQLIGNPAKLRGNVRDQLPPEARKMFDRMNKD